MKLILQFFAPTLKALIGVISILFTVVSISYGGIVLIARAEAKNIENKIIAVREADIYYIKQRFDKIDNKLDSIYREARK
jgi:p-aminobenzoyl-glutamate transporter AbgT